LFAAKAGPGRLISPVCAFPGCGKLPDHPLFAEQVRHWSAIQDGVKAEMAGMDPNLRNDPDKLLFFMCSKCHRPFFGGMAECGGADPQEELTCSRCARSFQGIACNKHPETLMSYKCFYCCRQALFFCFGTTHYCPECHTRPYEIQKGPWRECDGTCQFAPHPLNGQPTIHGYCAGCESEKPKH
jgi:E3 ubiquitin-protein ligase MYCBP2